MFESLFSKAEGLKTCNFIEKRLQHKHFPVNIAKFSRTTFFIEHAWWLLLLLTETNLLTANLLLCLNSHCMKSVQILSFFWSVFFCIRTEYGEIRSISPYSARMWENTEQKKLRIWTLFKQSVLRLQI